MCGTSDSIQHEGCTYLCPHGCLAEGALPWMHNGADLIAAVCSPGCQGNEQCPTHSSCATDVCKCDTGYKNCGAYCCPDVNSQVPDTGSVGPMLSIAVDNASRLHVIYGANGQGGLMHAVRDGANWTVETIDATTDCTELSAAIDASDRIHIVCVVVDFVNGVSDKLQYIHQTSVGWDQTTATTSGSLEVFPSIAVDHLATPHIVYNDDHAGLVHIRLANGSWVTEPIDPTSGNRKGTSLAADSQGKLHLSYWGEPAGIRYGVRDTTWTLESVEADSQSMYGITTSIRATATAQPRVAYSRSANKRVNLMLAARDTAWHAEVVQDIAGETGGPTLALDGANNARVCHWVADLAPNRYYVVCLQNNGSQWVAEALAAENGEVKSLSSAIDSSDRMNVCYVASNALRCFQL